MGNNGQQQVKPRAIIQIILTPDGRIVSQTNGVENRPMANMMLETAKQDILGGLMAAEHQAAQQKIVGVPPELAAMNLRG